MVRAIRQHVEVASDGLLELRSPELRSGQKAEVIVLVQDEAPAKPAQTPAERLALLDAIAKEWTFTPEAVAAWVKETDDEHKAWSERLERRTP